MSEPVVRISPQIAAELYAIRKTSWSLEEYRALADRFADAVQLFQIATENENFAGIRSAFLTLDDIERRTAFLNAGLCHAIQQVTIELCSCGTGNVCCEECNPTVEHKAADLWRSENPHMSVFSCSVQMKNEYRKRVMLKEETAPCK